MSGLHVSFRLDAGMYYQSYLVNGRVKEPLAIPSTSFVGYITDNPLRHGAAYTDFGMRAGIGSWLTAQTHLVLEHRGQSYGVYSVGAMRAYPRMHFSIDTSVTFWDVKFLVGGSVGNFDDMRQYEGLMFDHFDSQGSRGYIEWREFTLEYTKIADAESGIGLGINDVDDVRLTVNSGDMLGPWLGSASMGVTVFTGVFAREDGSLLGFPEIGNDYSYNFSAHIRRDGVRLYGQFSHRNAPYGDGNAALFGLRADLSDGPLTLSCIAEYRRYDAAFNRYFFSQVHYRPNSGSGKSMTAEYVYPLYFFDRPFSQWAVYTEYQGSDVRALVLQLAARLRIWHGIGVFLTLDVNDIQAGTTSSFTYPFFDAGAEWEPVKGVQLRYSMTNKGMNLDKNYPTFYLYKSPVIQMAARFSLGLLQL